MKRVYSYPIAGVVLACLLQAGLVTGALAQVAVSSNLSVVSDFISRGYVVTDRPTFQPSLHLTWQPHGLSLSLYGSAALAGRSYLGREDEVDLVVDHTRQVHERLAVSAGVTVYAFPGRPDFSRKARRMPRPAGRG